MINLDYDEEKFTCKIGDYCVGKAIDLAEPSFHNRAQEYRRKISGMMKPLSSTDVHRLPNVKDWYAARKFDGEFAVLLFDGKRLMSVNPGGTARIGLPGFIEAEKLLKKAKVKSCILAAEIYLRDKQSQAHPVHEVVGALRNPKTIDRLDKLGVAVFDIIELDEKPVTSTATVFTLLTKWFAGGKRVNVVDHIVADGTASVMKAFAEWVDEKGAEGVVLRHDRAGWYKIKTRHNLDAAIIGFSVGTERRTEMLHDLLVAVVRNDGTFQELTRVGGGFSDEERLKFAKDLRQRIVPSDYVAVNNDYVAYEMIEPGPVIEISFLDMIAERTKGGPVNRMVLEWTGEKYSALSRMPLVSVISPLFVRERDDKEASAEDTNIRQVAELVPVEESSKSADPNKKVPSEILARTVYTKTMKDNLMVRKLMMWKTNKEDDPDFPGFVVYFTDFSPNRKNQLERDLKVANKKSAAQRLFDDMAAKNFIGGWTKVS